MMFFNGCTQDGVSALQLVCAQENAQVVEKLLLGTHIETINESVSLILKNRSTILYFN